jgi:hypothetical protein
MLDTLVMLVLPVILVAIMIFASGSSPRVYWAISFALVLGFVVVWQLWPNITTLRHPPLGSHGYHTWSFPVAAAGSAVIVWFARKSSESKAISTLASVLMVWVLIQLGGWIS